MKLVLFITLVLLLSCSGRNQIEIDELFENELRKRNVSYTKAGDGLYNVETGDGLKAISIDNLALSYRRDNDVGKVERFVENVLQSLQDMPSWDEMKSGIFPSLEPSDYRNLNNYIHGQLTDSAVIILVYYSSDQNQVRFLRDVDLNQRGVETKQAWKRAYMNIDKIMSKTKVSFIDVDGQKLGLIEAEEPYKASLILSTTLKDKVSNELGWPIYAVTPARDFVYLFSKDSGLVDKVGHVVVREFKNSGYAISTDVWELSDSALVAIGTFPTE